MYLPELSNWRNKGQVSLTDCRCPLGLACILEGWEWSFFFEFYMGFTGIKYSTLPREESQTDLLLGLFGAWCIF